MRGLLVVALVLSACTTEPEPAAVLLFDGNGTSPGDVAALESILDENHLSYATAGSRQLNRMSESQLAAYRLLIVPGGNFEQIGNGLTPAATRNVRNAVHDGMNYLGICAGAFFAGNSPYNGLNLTAGVRFPFYDLEFRAIRKAPVEVSIAGSRRSFTTGRMVHSSRDGARSSPDIRTEKLRSPKETSVKGW